MRPRDLERERACFALLRALVGREAVLVGGYAVSAYGPPRFSLDLDLVTPAAEVPGFHAALREAGLARVRDWAGGAGLGGRAERWSRGKEAFPLAVDLLVDGISDRVSGASHPYAAIRRGARHRTVRGLDPSSEARPLVPSAEVLVALKLESARLVDLRDLAILAGAGVDAAAVAAFLRGVRRDVLEEHLDALSAALGRRDYEDSLKGVSMLDARAFRRLADRTRGLVLELREALSRTGRAERE